MASPVLLARLHQEIRSCTRCVDAGYLPAAGPVLSGHPDNRIMLIGQAPGAVELERRLPFQGRAGRTLMRWLERAGFPSEADARRRIYMTSITKCFPGKSRSTGGGDRRPSSAEIALCRPYLDRQLALIRPDVIILVGGLALERFLPGRSLDQLVGRAFDRTGRPLGRNRSSPPVLLPLPHPSGASRWLNDPAHQVLLERALRLLAGLVRPYLDHPRAAT